MATGTIFSLLTMKLESFVGVCLSTDSFELLWPPSRTSAPTWAVLCIATILLWVFSFVVLEKPDAIVRDEQERGKHYLEMMQAVLTYSDAEDKKHEKHRKPAEANRCYKLLFDDVHKVRTIAYGIEADCDINVRMESLFTRLLNLELEKAVTLTVQANDLEKNATPVRILEAKVSDGPGAPNKDEIKMIAEHKSGDKLNQAIQRTKEVRRNMGNKFGDKALLDRAVKALKDVNSRHSRKANAVLKLAGPVIPDVLVTIFFSVIQTGLRARYHQIGVWVRCVEVHPHHTRDRV